MALAFGALLLNEATGANAQNAHELEGLLLRFNNDVDAHESGDAVQISPLIADKIQALFGNEVIANWALGELLKIADGG